MSTRSAPTRPTPASWTTPRFATAGDRRRDPRGGARRGGRPGDGVRRPDTGERIDATLQELVRGRRLEGIHHTVFKSVGLAFEDLAVATCGLVGRPGRVGCADVLVAPGDRSHRRPSRRVRVRTVPPRSMRSTAIRVAAAGDLRGGGRRSGCMSSTWTWRSAAWWRTPGSVASIHETSPGRVDPGERGYPDPERRRRLRERGRDTGGDRLGGARRRARVRRRARRPRPGDTWWVSRWMEAAIRSRGRDPVDLDLMTTLGGSPRSALPGFVVTAVDRVGADAGPDVATIKRVARSGRPTIAAGGIASLEDLAAVRTRGRRRGGRGARRARGLAPTARGPRLGRRTLDLAPPWASSPTWWTTSAETSTDSRSTTRRCSHARERRPPAREFEAALRAHDAGDHRGGEARLAVGGCDRGGRGPASSRRGPTVRAAPRRSPSSPSPRTSTARSSTWTPSGPAVEHPGAAQGLPGASPRS